jgi:hypothetical protein
MKNHQTYLRQDREYYDSSLSSASGRTRNTWSSSNRGLIQIGSFKISPTETDDFSMGDESSHRFSVIIHDNTDVSSFANASSRQIEALHGLEDPNINKKTRSSKLFSKLKLRHQDDSSISSKSSANKGKLSSLRKPRSEFEVEEDSFDHLCNAMEGFVCRPNEKRSVITKESRVVESRDALDTVPEGIEKTTPEENLKLNSQSSSGSDASPDSAKQEAAEAQSKPDNRDKLDKVFDGVEIMTCGPDSSHNVRPEAKKKSASEKKTNKNARNNSKSNKNIFDSTCESIELFVCRNDTTEPKFSQEPDLLDMIFDGTTSSPKTNEKQESTPKDASRSMRKGQNKVVTKIVEISNSQDDALDYLCNGVEYSVCRSQAVAVKESNDRDLLDHIFDPSCNGQDDNDSFNQNSLVASIQSGGESLGSDFGLVERKAPEAVENQHSDFLDCFFENIESRTCRPPSQ